MAEPPVRPVAVVGAGLIGASWAASFLARGHAVAATDTAPGSEVALVERIATVWPDLCALDPALPPAPPLDRLRFTPSLAEAVAGAEIVQESITEQLAPKIALFAQLDALCPAGTLLLSSTSALPMSQIQSGCARHPERCAVGHPFNPPHLVPLVEVVGGALTSERAIEGALAFYRDAGRRPVRIRAELPGHVANRLQAALMREAVDLVESGVVDVSGVDDIARWGPGLRWALMGPLMVTYLGVPEHRRDAFPASVAAFMTDMWERDLKTPTFGPETCRRIAEGIQAELAGRPAEAVAAERDRLLIGLLRLSETS